MNGIMRAFPKDGFTWDDRVLFYFAFFLMAFAKAFGLDKGNSIYYVLFAAAALLLGVRILVMIKKDVRVLAKIIFVLLPCGVLFLSARETTLLFTGLFLAASKDIDFEKAMKGGLVVYLTAIPLKLCLYLFGIIEGGSKDIYVYDIEEEVAYYLETTYGYGYNHPNAFMAAVVIAILLLFYIRRDKLTLPLLMTSSAAVAGVFWLTQAKTGMIIYLLMLVGVLLLKLLQRYKTNTLVLYCAMIILAAVAMGILFPLCYSPENRILKLINHKVISGRFSLAQDAMASAGISLLGKGSAFSDILYIDVLLNCGILGLAWVLFGAGIWVTAFIKERNDMGLLCAAVMILYGCMEQFPLNIAMNPILLYAGTNAIYRTERKSNDCVGHHGCCKMK